MIKGKKLNLSEKKPAENAGIVASANRKAKMYALGRLKKGKMNTTEEQYSQHLEELKTAGEILSYSFESMKFKIADNTFYTPDFMVLRADNVLEAHEVKGYWQDDARVKIKVAAALHPIQFIAVKKRPKKDGGGWETEYF